MSAITGLQIRAARAMLRWRAEDLASRAGVGVATIRRAEAHDGDTGMTDANSRAVRQALEAAGIRITDAPFMPGVIATQWERSIFDDARSEAPADIVASCAHTIAQEIRAILNAAGDPMHHATTGLRHVPHADRLLAGLQAVLGKRTDAAWAFGDKDIDVLRARAAGAQYLAHYLANLADGYEDPVPPAPGNPDLLTIASLLL